MTICPEQTYVVFLTKMICLSSNRGSSESPFTTTAKLWIGTSPSYSTSSGLLSNKYSLIPSFPKVYNINSKKNKWINNDNQHVTNRDLIKSDYLGDEIGKSEIAITMLDKWLNQAVDLLEKAQRWTNRRQQWKIKIY